MANLPISGLPAATGITHADLVAIVQGGTTKKITWETMHAEPVLDAGIVAGTVNVDLTQSHWFKFELNGDVDVALSGGTSGEEYIFWVYSNGNFSINSMSYDGGSIYTVGGSLPNPSNNSWSIYRSFAFDNDLVLLESTNLQAL